MNIADIAAAGPTGPQHLVSRKTYPDGWQPRLEVDETDGGYLISTPSPVETPKSHEEMLSEFGLSSSEWIINNVRRSRWQKFDGEWLESCRLTLVPARAANSLKVDFADLENSIKNWTHSYVPPRNQSGASFFAPIGDTQIGKSKEAGGGSQETVNRFLIENNKSVNRFLDLNSRIVFDQVVIPQLGDCIEGRTSQAGKNVWRTDLSMTEMVRVYRRLLWLQIKSYAALAPKVLVPIVPGNHDEARDQHGTVATDSWAIDAASAIQEAIEENEELKDKVSFVFPEYDELSVAVDVSGTSVGFNHGHKFGSDPLKWWSAQSAMRTPIGDCDLLLCGHLHHLKVMDHAGGRTFMQIPALDGGSRWFEHTKGTNSPSRAVTFWVADGKIRDLDPIGRS